jgi:hypothetical protein
LNFRELKYSSLLMTGDLSSSSLTDSGERNLLCFPDEELLICKQCVYLVHFCLTDIVCLKQGSNV